MSPVKSLSLRLLLIALAAAVLSPSAQARLYDDQRTLIARYGKPQKLLVTNQLAKGVTFRRKGVRTSVMLIDGRAHHISFITRRGWPEAEIANVLALNGDGHSWKRTSPATWERADGRAYANVDGARLTIYTDVYVVARKNLGSRDGTEEIPVRQLVTPSVTYGDALETKPRGTPTGETVEVSTVKTKTGTKTVTVTRRVISRQPEKKPRDEEPAFRTIERAKD
jgi:hypothetical protein